MNEEQLARIERALAAGIIGAEAITELIELIGLLSNWGVSVSDVVEAIAARYPFSWHDAFEYAADTGLPIFGYKYGRMDIE